MFLKDQSDIRKCSSCDNGFLTEKLFEISNLPLVDSFSKSSESAKKVPTSTVTIRSCNCCKTVQIDNPINPVNLYKSYIYDSKSSPDLENHFEGYLNDLNTRGLLNNSRILEIGINDGLLAEKIIDSKPLSYVGIDPSPQSASIKTQGISIINDFFSSDLIKDHNLEKGTVDLILANHVLSHIPNLIDTFRSINHLLTAEGILVFEVQSLAHMLEGGGFDYIYHEHIFYHTLESLNILLTDSGLRIYDVSLTPVKGGSYRIFACKIDDERENSARLDYYKFFEKLIKPHSNERWSLMNNHVSTIKSKIHHVLENCNKKILGYGASATGTVLLRYLELDNLLESIIDDNTKRQGLYAPKSALPILDSSSIKNDSLVLCLAWRHYGYYKNKLENINHIVPMPFLQHFDNNID